MKKYIYGSVIALLAFVYFVPGEALVQLGLRKISLEQGIAQASRHHSWDAATDADATEVAQAEPDAARKPVKKPGKR